MMRAIFVFVIHLLCAGPAEASGIPVASAAMTEEIANGGDVGRPRTQLQLDIPEQGH